MIKCIDDLIVYTVRLGESLPSLRESIVLERPGCTLQEMEKIVASFPNMPESYLRVVRDIRLIGIAIGYFQLAPNYSQGGTLYEALLDCNSNAGMKRHFQSDGVYQVGAWDADPICVSHRIGRYAPGQIVKYNAGNPEHDAAVLADSYEEYLLLAGNLDMARDKYSDADDPSEGLPEFNAYVDKIAPGRSVWMVIAEVVLS